MRLLVLSFFLLLFASCSSTGGEQSNLLDSFSNKNSKLEAELEDRVQSAKVYLDYSTVLEADALYRDRSYRLSFAKELSEVYFLDGDAKAKIWAQHSEDYENFYSFVLVLYPGNNKRMKFGKPSSEWQAYLKDDEGDLLRPVKIKKLNSKHRELIFLHKYLTPLDRWSQSYLVSFPKLHREIAEGTQAVELIISGFQGKAVIKFKDLSRFTQSRDSYQLD